MFDFTLWMHFPTQPSPFIWACTRNKLLSFSPLWLGSSADTFTVKNFPFSNFYMHLILVLYQAEQMFFLLLFFPHANTVGLQYAVVMSCTMNIANNLSNVYCIILNFRWHKCISLFVCSHRTECICVFL